MRAYDGESFEMKEEIRERGGVLRDSSFVRLSRCSTTSQQRDQEYKTGQQEEDTAKHCPEVPPAGNDKPNC